MYLHILSESFICAEGYEYEKDAKLDFSDNFQEIILSCVSD
jgi:hypothetical protein